MAKVGGVNVDIGLNDVSSGLATAINTMISAHDPRIQVWAVHKALIAVIASYVPQEMWEETVAVIREDLRNIGPEMAKEFNEARSLVDVDGEAN